MRASVSAQRCRRSAGACKYGTVAGIESNSVPKASGRLNQRAMHLERRQALPAANHRRDSGRPAHSACKVAALRDRPWHPRAATSGA